MAGQLLQLRVVRVALRRVDGLLEAAASNLNDPLRDPLRSESHIVARIGNRHRLVAEHGGREHQPRRPHQRDQVVMVRIRLVHLDEAMQPIARILDKIVRQIGEQPRYLVTGLIRRIVERIKINGRAIVC